MELARRAVEAERAAPTGAVALAGAECGGAFTVERQGFRPQWLALLRSTGSDLQCLLLAFHRPPMLGT